MISKRFLFLFIFCTLNQFVFPLVMKVDHLCHHKMVVFFISISKNSFWREMYASNGSLSSDILFLEYVFIIFKHEKLLSTDTLIDGKVANKEKFVCLCKSTLCSCSSCMSSLQVIFIKFSSVYVYTSVTVWEKKKKKPV